DAYARMFAHTGSGQSLDIALGAQHFPFTPTTQRINITRIRAILLFTAEKTYDDYAALGATNQLKTHLGPTRNDGAPPTTVVPFGAISTVLGGLPIADMSPTAPGVPVGPVTLALLEADIANTPLLDLV